MNLNKITYWITEYAILLRWTFLFAAIASTIYLANQTDDAALLAIFIIGYIACLNFSIPTPLGHISFAPILAIVSFFLLGEQITLISLLSCLILSELVFPLWRPFWYQLPFSSVDPNQPTRSRVVIGQAIVYGTTFTVLWLWPTTSIWQTALLYLIVHTAAYLAIVRWIGITWTAFRQRALPYLILSYLLIPTAWLALLLFSRFGLFFFAITIALFLLFNLVWWAAWQNRHILGEQIQQLQQLNLVAAQQRETLDVLSVAQRAYEQISALIEIDQFALWLTPASQQWRPVLLIINGTPQSTGSTQTADEFTQWVQQSGRTLDINRTTLHYAKQHNITPPSPFPQRWLGIPLISKEQTLGVLVLQQDRPNQVIDQWSQELLSAIVRQTSDGLENALQHDQTLALYTSTDQALSQRAEQLQAVLAATSDAITLLDTTAEITFSNPFAQHLLQQHAPHNYFGFSQAEWQSLKKQIQNSEPLQIEEALVPLAITGEDTRWFERNITAVTHQNSLLGWLIVLRDITELQERVEWREQFTDMIVHDLRNPISTLLTNFDFMRSLYSKESAMSQESAEKHISTGTQVSQHMLDMVDSLMDAARLSAGRFILDAEAMHLRPQIERVAQQMENQFQRKQITLSIQAPEKLPPVWADQELVRRILVNLVDNAVKFTPSNGKIEISLQVESFVNSEDGLKCSVKDTGPGIPPDKREAIFGRFVQIDNDSAKTRGSGIGLSFCKQAIEIQNGRIWVEDTAADWGTGSQFVFTLPGIPYFDLGDTNR